MHVYCTVLPVNQLFDDGESQTDAVEASVCRLPFPGERFKHFFLEFPAHAYSVILTDKAYFRTVFIFGIGSFENGNIYRTALIAVFDCVGYDIHHDLAQIQRLTDKRLARAIRILSRKRHSGSFCAFIGDPDDFFRFLRGIEHGAVVAFACLVDDLIDGQYIVDKVEQIFGRFPALITAGSLQLGVVGIAGSDLNHTEDNVYGSACVVAYAAQQIRFALICGLLRLHCGFQLFLIFQFGFFLFVCAFTDKDERSEVSVFVSVLRNYPVALPFATDVLIVIFQVTAFPDALVKSSRIAEAAVAFTEFRRSTVYKAFVKCGVCRSLRRDVAPFPGIFQQCVGSFAEVDGDGEQINTAYGGNDIVFALYLTVMTDA